MCSSILYSFIFIANSPPRTNLRSGARGTRGSSSRPAVFGAPNLCNTKKEKKLPFIGGVLILLAGRTFSSCPIFTRNINQHLSKMKKLSMYEMKRTLLALSPRINSISYISVQINCKCLSKLYF